MKSRTIRHLLSVGLAVLLTYLPVLGVNSPVGKLIPRSGTTLLNGIALTSETTLFGGDALVTQADSLAMLLLSRGDQIHFGPETAAAALGGADNLVIDLERGSTVIRSASGRPISVNARGLLIRPVGAAIYQVAIDGKAIVVGSEEGNLEVQGTNRSVMLASGKAMKFEVTPESRLGPTGAGAHNIGPAAAIAISLAISLGITIPTSVVLANRAQEEACEDALQAQGVSPSVIQETC